MKGSERNEYLPRPAEIIDIEDEACDTKTFRLRLKTGGVLEFSPGQFVQVSVFGAGEVPLSVSSSPFEKGHFEISVRKFGVVTEALFGLKKGGVVGIRGPYGKGYPVEKFIGKDIVIAAGGVGIAAVSAVIEHIMHNRKDYGKVWLLYGAHCPSNVMFNKRMKKWCANGIEAMVTVTVTKGEKWKGEIGYVEPLLEKLGVRAHIGICCGPPGMMNDLYNEFKRLGIDDEHVYFSLERMMQCGIGKCGHCNIGRIYVCTDGPVFTYAQLKGITENIWG